MGFARKHGLTHQFIPAAPGFFILSESPCSCGDVKEHMEPVVSWAIVTGAEKEEDDDLIGMSIAIGAHSSGAEWIVDPAGRVSSYDESFDNIEQWRAARRVDRAAELELAAMPADPKNSALH